MTLAKRISLNGEIGGVASWRATKQTISLVQVCGFANLYSAFWRARARVDKLCPYLKARAVQWCERRPVRREKHKGGGVQRVSCFEINFVVCRKQKNVQPEGKETRICLQTDL